MLLQMGRIQCSSSHLLFLSTGPWRQRLSGPGLQVSATSPRSRGAFTAASGQRSCASFEPRCFGVAGGSKEVCACCLHAANAWLLGVIFHGEKHMEVIVTYPPTALGAHHGFGNVLLTQAGHGNKGKKTWTYLPCPSSCSPRRAHG